MNIPENYNWKPRPEDIAWAKNMLAMGKDQFTWGFPGALSIYQIDKIKKTIKMIAGPVDEHHWKTVIAFNAVGYEMIEDNAFAE